MKKFKKIFAIILVITIILSNSTSSFAADRDVTNEYKIKTQKMLRNFDQYLGFCCRKGATFKYDIYARTTMLSIPNLLKIHGKSTKYAKNKLSNKMKLFFGTSSMKFKKFSGRYKWRKDPSNVIVSKNGKIEYTSGDWGTAIPCGKIIKINQTKTKKFDAIYKVYMYDNLENIIRYEMGTYKVTMKKANNKYGFIIDKIKRVETHNVMF